MNKLFYLIFFGIGILLNPFPAGAQPDFTHMRLEVDLDTVHREVNGKVQLRFVIPPGTDSIGIDGIKMTYEEVLLNGKAIAYQSNAEALWFTGAETVADTNVLQIQYRCRPRKGLFFIGWHDPTGRAPRQVWTQGQGIDHRHWIPYNDDQTDKLLVDLHIRFDSSYQVVANGILQEQRTTGEETYWHYRMNKPMSGYLIALTIGKYAQKNTLSDSGIPLTQYYYPERAEDYPVYYYKNETIFNFMEKEIGVPYPWVNYKQVPVQDFHHGAMENTTATIFGDFFLVDSVAFHDRNYTYVNAHELAHQWFGNLVTATGSDEHWLHEGFATFYQWLSERNIYGEEFFDWMRHEEAQMVFEASQQDTIPLGNGKAGSARFYQKGAWVLYMLRNELGEADFQKSIEHYLRKYAYGLVTTDSLAYAIQEVTGKDYRPFFRQWIHTAGEPVLKVRGRTEGKALTLSMEPEYMPFEEGVVQLPVVMVYTNGSRSTHSIPLSRDKKKVTLEVPEGQRLDYWVVNPGQALLIQLREEKPGEVWQRQYDQSTALLDRYAALRGIAKDQSRAVRKKLTEVLRDPRAHYALRVEAMQSLWEATAEHQYLETALSSQEPSLQKAALALIREPDATLRAQARSLQRAPSYEVRQNALPVAIDPGNPDANRWLYDPIYAREPGIPGHKVEITVLLYRVLLFRDREALNTLVLRASSGFDFITRMNAMQALQQLNYFDATVCAHYFDALFAYNWQLRRTARQQLMTYYKDQAEGADIIRSYIHSHEKEFTDFQKRMVHVTFDL